MRKLLVFLLLLGGGLFLLYWLDRRRSPPREGPPVEPTPPSLPAGETQGVQIGGKATYTAYDKVTRNVALRVESEEARTEAGVDHLAGVTLEIFDPATTGVVQARLRAERARARRTGAADELTPDWELRLELEGVQAQLVTGVPLAPLSFQSPTAVVDLTDPAKRRVLTEDEFSARSPELSIDGRGLYCEIDHTLLEIAHAGRVELRRAAGTPVSFEATGQGAMQVRRSEGPDGPVTLEAWQGAALGLGGEEQGRLTAEHVSVRALPGPGPEGELAVERLDAEGSVDWSAGESRFQGRRLAASFAPEGRLERARLEGEPRAELAIKLAGVGLPEVEAEGERRILVTGRDVLDITWKEGGFELGIQGLPSVETKDFRLKSASAIDGWLAEDRRSARFHASGGVEVESGQATLETPDFVVAIAPDASGETVLSGKATGGARLEGSLASPPDASGQPGPARAFTLASPDGLELERSSRGWRVVESTRVEVTLDDPDGFRARADRVTDFVVPQSATGELEPAGLRFQAEGAIGVELANGRLGGEELEVLAVEPVPHFLIRGTETTRAFYAGEYGEASALEVERTGDTYVARGAVTGSFELAREAEGPVSVSFAGDEVTFERTESPELLPGERLRRWRLAVVGHVQSTAQASGETLVAHCERLSVERRERLVEGADAPVELGALVLAEGAVHADVLAEGSDLTLDCDRLEVERLPGDVERGFRQLVASGSVRFQGRREFDVGGECELLVLDPERRRGSLEADPHGRVMLGGRLPGKGAPFRLTGERVDFEAGEDGELRLLALRPELRLLGPLGVRARAEHLTADADSGVVLSGGVRASGALRGNEPFTLDADEIVLVGRRQPGEGGSENTDELDALLARGHVDFHLGADLRARGERLVARRASGVMRLEGAPASFETSYARLETDWVEFDPLLSILVATGRGRMFAQEPAAPGAPPSWAVDFLSASTLLELDSVVFVIQEPVFHTAQFQSALRASWAVLWLNREAFQDARRREELLDGLQRVFDRFEALPRGANLAEVLAALRTDELAGLLREVYFEGPVEVLSEGELFARADAIYLDAASQHGWLSRATVNLAGQFLGQRHEKLIVKTDWLRLSSDGSLRADRATVTSCSYDDPHVRVVTGDLRIEPITGQDKAAYRLLLKHNRIELYDLLTIPLPTIDVATNEEFKPLWPTLSLANSARFGTLFSFAITRPADNVGKVVNDTIGRESTEVDANYKVDGSYLGSRGGLLDLGLEVEGKDEYWLDLFLGLALDRGDDRGFVRVDEDERDTVRRWLRSQGYFANGRSAWSFSYSDQSDAGVQSEFYEGQFLRYERSESYLQFRHSAEENFVQGSVKLRTDGFRSDIEELPSLSAYRGRSPLARLGSLTLLHTGDVRAEYLRRREGSEPRSPFSLPTTFPDGNPSGFGELDGLGDREVLRVDTTQAVELPVPLGGGFKLTPFLSARASAWNEGADEDDSPTRLIAEGGARLGTTFWKRAEGGKLHELAPFVELRSELEREDDDGVPVEFDEVERVLSGDFLRLGTRGRFLAGAEGSMLDLDLVGTYARERSDGGPDGWLPVEVLGRLVLEPFGHEFEVFHDGRFDVEENRTTYSLLSVGTHFGEEWGVQASHQRGLDSDQRPLFEAASVSGLYRWTEKWEFEGRESFSLLEDQELDTRVVVRRYGHDIVFEVESSFREGEGSSFGISVKPRFGYHPPRVGYVPW